MASILDTIFGIVIGIFICLLSGFGIIGSVFYGLKTIPFTSQILENSEITLTATGYGRVIIGLCYASIIASLACCVLLLIYYPWA